LIRAIDQAITQLKARHKTHINVYGRDNDRRLTGRHETAHVSETIDGHNIRSTLIRSCQINQFNAGIANRGASVRIPRQVGEDRCGYLEDRRPASNCDPYAVTGIIVRTVCLGEEDTHDLPSPTPKALTSKN
jgi:glutamine synthetase